MMRWKKKEKSKDLIVCQIFQCIYKTILSYCFECRKITLKPEDYVNT